MPTGLQSPVELSYLVNARLPAGEGECEAQGQLGSLEAHIVQEVSNALHDVVKQLQGESVRHTGPAVAQRSWLAPWSTEPPAWPLPPRRFPA